MSWGYFWRRCIKKMDRIFWHRAGPSAFITGFGNTRTKVTFMFNVWLSDCVIYQVVKNTYVNELAPWHVEKVIFHNPNCFPLCGVKFTFPTLILTLSLSHFVKGFFFRCVFMLFHFSAKAQLWSMNWACSPIVSWHIWAQIVPTASLKLC